MGQRSRHINNVLNFYSDDLNPTFPVKLFADCPWLTIQADPSVGFTFFEDWNNYTGVIADADPPTADGWVLTQSNSTGGLALGGDTGGSIALDSEAVAEFDGLQMQANEVPFIPSATNDLWFEAKFKITDSAINSNMFVGLSIKDTTIMASGDLTPTNCIGFTIEDDEVGVVKFVSRKAGNEKSDASLITLTDATYTTLGFKINKLDTVDIFVDGVKTVSTNVTSGIPIVRMTPSFQINGDSASASVSDPILEWDYIKAAQVGR